jgi:hypothetical protein
VTIPAVGPDASLLRKRRPFRWRIPTVWWKYINSANGTCHGWDSARCLISGTSILPAATVRLRPAGICRRQSGLRLDRPAPAIRTLGTLPSNTSSSPMAAILHRAVRHVRRVQLPPPPHPTWVLLSGPHACSCTQARKRVGSPSTKFLGVSVRRTGTRFPSPPH